MFPEIMILPNRPYKPERSFGLDLMRAVAVLLVMFSHWANNIGIWYGYKASAKLFFAGDVGVDTFFALSGFLIGRILLDVIDRGPSCTSLGTFLARRWMRTLPLYWSWLAVLAVFRPPMAGAQTLSSMVLLLQNFAWPMPQDFFFAVSWSLTIEEWFYIGFGLSLVGGAMVLGSGAIWPVLLTFLLVPLTLRLSIPAYPPWSNGLWHTVVFRLDATAYGVLLAKLLRRKLWPFPYASSLFSLGIALIGGTWIIAPPLPLWLVPALLDTIIIVGAVLCIPALMHLNKPTGFIASLITAISVRSYSLYIIHLTLLVDLAQSLYFHHFIPRWVAVCIAVILPFILSDLSFRFIERPILSMRPVQR